MSGDGRAVPARAMQARAQTVQAGAGQAGTLVSPGRLPSLRPGPAWLQALPPLATLAVVLWGITGSSYWRDEAATLSAVQRPFGNLVRMLGSVDAVHGAYYMLLWVVVRLGGTGELVTRLPSALAMAGAAAAVAALGRRLVSPRAGLASGLVFAVLPEVSWYGQDARSYAMVTALAAAASYLLVRATRAARRRGRTGWLAAYGGCLAVLGAANIFGLLLIAAHAVTVALAWRRAADRRAARSLALGWLAAAAAAAALVSPIMVLAWTQRGQLAWLSPAGLAGLAGLQRLVGSGAMAIAVGAAVGCGIIASALRGRERLRARWPGSLVALSVPWLILPPAILLGAAPIAPAYAFRYVMFCIPAVALLAGTGLAALGRATGVIALGLIAVLGLPFQMLIRTAGGHGDDILQADRIVAGAMHPGDPVLYATPENYRAAYPFGLARLRDIAQDRSPVESATLGGTSLPPSVVRQRLAHVGRLWVVEIHHLAPVAQLQGLGLRKIRTWRTYDIWLLLYVRDAGSTS